MTRKIIVSIATSAGGYIARSDGGVDWLDRPRPKGNYGMGEFFRSIDTILWGRKTFEPVLKDRGKSLGYGPKARNYVFTHNPTEAKIEGVEFTSEPPAEVARRLRAEPGKDIWIMGGAGLIASFLDVGEIDEFRIAVVPTFIGEGIRLIEPRRRTVPLELIAAQPHPDGVVLRQTRRSLQTTDPAALLYAEKPWRRNSPSRSFYGAITPVTRAFGTSWFRASMTTCGGWRTS